MDHRDPVINGNKKFIIIHDDISVPYILIGFYHNKRRKGRKLKSVIYDICVIAFQWYEVLEDQFQNLTLLLSSEKAELE